MEEMMNNFVKYLSLLGMAILGAHALNAGAAPLAAGIKLGITQGLGSSQSTVCPTGSCFSMELAPGFIFWTDYRGGSDGGFVVGKDQKSGGQELALSDTNSATGEMTAAWLFFGNYGTFFSTPGGSTNIFDDAPCAKAACIGKTDLKVFIVAWNGNTVPMGSAVGCSQAACTPDQQAGIFVSDYQINPVTGGAWSIDYSQVVPANPPNAFVGIKFRTVIRGSVVTSTSTNIIPPTAGNIALCGLYSSPILWSPVVADTNVPALPVTCHIGTAAANASVYVAPNCSSGGYTPDLGFIGTDSFTYIANNGVFDSIPGTVTLALVAPPPPPLDIYLTTTQGQAIPWDAGSPTISSCTISQMPAYGSATVESACKGVYTPASDFVGYDHFYYIATVGTACPVNLSGTVHTQVCAAGTNCGNPTPSATSTPTPIVDGCYNFFPVTQFSQTGKSGTLSITFTGNITSRTNKEVKVCPGSTLSYQSTSTRGPVLCKIKNNTTRGSGNLKINDHLKCTDKPAGKDKVQFKVKSGVK
jgi:hypothetical protein